MKTITFKSFIVIAMSLLTFIACEPAKQDKTNSNEKSWKKEDHEAVKAAILDYVEGLYEVDSTRIDRSVDASLRKVGYYYTPSKEWRDNLPMTQKQLSSLAARWNKKGDQVNDSTPKKIEIYDISSKTASAKLTAAWGIDYFHLGKYDNQWKIMNVIWQSMPQE